MLTHPTIHREQLIAWLMGRATPVTDDSEQGIQEILNDARREGVLELVYESICEHGLNRQLPQYLVSELSAITQKQSIFEQHQILELRRVLEIFGANEIKSLVIKGTALAHSIYKNPHSRFRFDTDILIRYQDVSACRAVLTDQQFVCQDFGNTRYLTGQFKAIKIDDNGVESTLDVHWRINNRLIVGYMFGFDELFADSVTVEKLSNQARTPSSEHALLIACLHRAASRYPDKLSGLYDTHLLLGLLDENQLGNALHSALSRKMGALFIDAIMKTAKIFDSPLPDGFIQQAQTELVAREKEFSARLLRPGRSNFDDRWDDFLSLDHASKRLRYLCEFLFPPKVAMAQHYGANRPPPLPVMYVSRMLGGLKKLVSK